MARIPTLQRRATLPTTTGVPAAPVVLIDDQTGQGLKQVGGVVSEIGENQLRARADAMVTQSYVNATLKMDELKESIDTNKILSWESDPNSSQFNPGAVAPTADPDDVKARMAQIYDTASEGLSPYGLEKFKKDYSMLSAKGQIEIRREQVTRDNAELQAHNLAVLDTLIKGSTKDGTDAVWVASLKKGIESIDSLEFNRQIGPKKAEKLRQTFRTQMNAVKGDRLTAGIELAEARGLRTVDIDEEDGDAQKRLDDLDVAIKEAVEFGAITRTQGTKIRLAFLRKVDTAMAQMQIEADPAEYLRKEENKKYLPNLESEQRSKFVERAQARIDRKLRKDQTAADAAERKFINDTKVYIEAFSVAGAEDASPEVLERTSDASIDTNVSDPDTAKALKLLVKDAKDFAGVRRSIGGKSQTEIAAMRGQLVADAEQTFTDVAEAGLKDQNVRQLQLFDQALKDDATARRKDPAQYAIANNDEVAEQFANFNGALSNPSSGPKVVAIAYGNYQEARNAAYAAMDIPLDMQKRLPKNFVAQQVAIVRESEPEQIAQRFSAMSAQMGPDWRHMLKEMVAEDLPPSIAALAVVENDFARQELAGIAKAGGMKALKENVDTEDVDDATKVEVQRIRNIAGSGNIEVINALGEAMRLLAVNDVAQGTSVRDAMDRAKKLVITDNYQMVNQGKLRGIVPKGSIESPAALMYGLNSWLRQDANLKTIDLNQFPQGRNEAQKKELVRTNAQWTLTPDASGVELRTTNGTPVRNNEGKPVVVPVANIQTERLGARGKSRLRAATQIWERKGPGAPRPDKNK